MWEVDVQSQQGHAAEEGHGAHEDPVVTGVLVAVEDAVLFHFVGAVDIALVGDAAKDHNGEELQSVQQIYKKWMSEFHTFKNIIEILGAVETFSTTS